MRQSNMYIYSRENERGSGSAYQRSAPVLHADMRASADTMQLQDGKDADPASVRQTLPNSWVGVFFLG